MEKPEMHVFTIEIAGVPAEIRCRCSDNKSFFKEYISDKTPVITIEPSNEDIAQAQRIFDEVDDAHGIPKCKREISLLENNAIHAILAEKLLEYGVLLIHGSSLCIDGHAIVFIAPSGTGKSTHTSLWRKVFGERVWMINDDKPMIRIFDDKAIVYGTPWNGKHKISTNGSAPLKAIVRLTRDKTNHIETMKKSEAYSALITHTYRSRDTRIMTLVMELEKKLLDTADFYLLGCNMTPEAAEVAWKGIK